MANKIQEQIAKTNNEKKTLQNYIKSMENEIAKALNIDNKQINYQIKKAIRLCQELYRG